MDGDALRSAAALPSFSPHFAKRKLVKLALRGRRNILSKMNALPPLLMLVCSGNTFVRTIVVHDRTS